jgi:hypothetical protein
MLRKSGFNRRAQCTLRRTVGFGNRVETGCRLVVAVQSSLQFGLDGGSGQTRKFCKKQPIHGHIPSIGLLQMQVLCCGAPKLCAC